MSELGQKLISIVRRKAAEDPGFVYEHIDDPDRGIGGCAYVYNGQPSCLIGQALFEAGVISVRFEFSGRNQDSISFLIENLNLPIDDREIDWLSEVQDGQDIGRSWGLAVEMVDDASSRSWPW